MTNATPPPGPFADRGISGIAGTISGPGQSHKEKNNMIRELVVISGKGGTGKTSLSASLAVLAGNAVIADCDVDAADMHLLLQPKILQSHDFISGFNAFIDNGSCTSCDSCIPHCAFGAITALIKSTDTIPGFEKHFSVQGSTDLTGAVSRQPGKTFPVVDPLACEGCKVCSLFCPENAIFFKDNLCGHHFISETRCGPMVHAKLAAGAGNSGKLVSLVRQKARKIAKDRDLRWIITDGPPGIGCPVIASITGATHVLAVTEPSVSGMHDLARLLELTRHFDVSTSVCVNRFDIHQPNAEQIRETVEKEHVRFAGFIPWDPAFTESQKQGKTVVEYDSPASRRIIEIWKTLQTFLDS